MKNKSRNTIQIDDNGNEVVFENENSKVVVIDEDQINFKTIDSKTAEPVDGKSVITEKTIRKNKLKTLNNIMCVINDEIKKIADINKKNDRAMDCMVRECVNNITMLSNSISLIEKEM